MKPTSVKTKISFIFNNNFIKDKDKRDNFRKNIRSSVKFVLKNEEQDLSFLNLIFCDNETIKEYNNKFLSHNYNTDIITFYDYDETNILYGELLISAEQVKLNAKDYGVKFNDELKRVIIHGVLHLCGYTDKTKLQQKMMRKREDFYLKSTK